MLVAVINGNFDLAIEMLNRGADPNLASDDGVAPLFATLNNYWALRTWYPQPTAASQQKTSHLQMLEAIGGAEQIDRAYREALRERYLWHEFGDTHVLFTRCRPDLAWAV